MKKLLFITLISGLLVSCKGKDDEPPVTPAPSYTDSRDNQTYLTVDLYGKTWFKENLRYEVPTSTTDSTWCYDNDCSQGRLYNHAAALKACPSGWHLPTSVDLDELRDSLAGGSGPVLD